MKWRAKYGETFYFLGSLFNVEKTQDYRETSKSAMWLYGNYFRTKTHAERVSRRILKTVNAPIIAPSKSEGGE